MSKVGVEDYFVGIDIGGTRIKAVISCNNKVLKQKIILSGAGLSKDKIILKIVKLVENLLDFVCVDGLSLKGIGVGVPGLFEKNGRIVNLPHLQNLNGVNLKKILSDKFGCKVKIVNDAQLCYFYHKEFLREKNVAYLTLGTSLGCCLVLNGKLYVGNGLASQFGNSYFISRRKSMRLGYVLATDYLVKSCCKKGFEVLDFKEFKKFVKSGNVNVLSAFEEYGNNLGFALRNIYQILHLDKIYLMGGLTHFSKYFLDVALKNFESNGEGLGVCSVEVISVDKGVAFGAVGASRLF